MTNSTKHKVAVFGANEDERRVLNRIFKLSSSRAHSYILADVGREEAVDVFLINKEYPEAVAGWEAARSVRKDVPTLLMCAAETPETGPSIRRPFMATRVLSTLDTLMASSERGANGASGYPAEAKASSPEVSPVPAPSERVEAGCGAGPVAPQDNVLETPMAAVVEPPIRVLVVDDSVTARKQIGTALKRANIGAEVVGDGERALDLVAGKRYDVVFLDVVMPGVDGYEVCKAIKRNRATRNTPVVMLTGKSSPFDKVKGKLSGCDSYLTKPVKLAEFKSTLEEFLREPVSFALPVDPHGSPRPNFKQQASY